MLNLAISTGEPAGVGPDIVLSLLTQHRDELLARLDRLALGRPVHLHVLGDVKLMHMRANQLGIRIESIPSNCDSCAVSWHDVPLSQPCESGRLNVANAPYVLQLLDTALEGWRVKAFDALVTAPVHKGIINEAGIPFSGHTEYLADATNTPQVVMMLAGPQMARQGMPVLRVALASTHLPLSAVPASITRNNVLNTLNIIHHDLQHHFGIKKPHILVSGLNPHAGEGGHLGREEIEHIEPALKDAQALGLHVSGPFPADTLFQPRLLDGADCVLAMYHDQGLAVLKYATFGRGVNVTLGLPMIRTSVDHGTALDLAGSGQAHAGSLLEAVVMAAQMAAARAHV